MNKRQTIVLWIGIIILVLMGIFPPIHIDISDRFWRGDGPRPWEPGYDFLFTMLPSKISFSKLFIQWFIIAVVTGGLIVTFKDKKSKDDQKR